MSDNVTFQGLVATVEFTCKMTKDGESVGFVAMIDYEGCTQEQMMIWSNRNRVIELQNQLRAAGLEGGEELFRSLAKEKILRNAADIGKPFVAVDRLAKQMEAKLRKLSPDERLAQIAKMQAMVDALISETE